MFFNIQKENDKLQAIYDKQSSSHNELLKQIDKTNKK